MYLFHTCVVAAILAVLPAQAHPGTAPLLTQHFNTPLTENLSHASSLKVRAGNRTYTLAGIHPFKNWDKYDFIPGNDVLFMDNMIGEGKGEFPAHWHLHKGLVEVAIYGSENTLEMVDNGTTMSPQMPAPNWLPEAATIEMDLFFATNDPKTTYEIYLVEDTGKKKKKINGDFAEPILVGVSNVHFKKHGTESEALAAETIHEKWRHLAIAVTQDSLKVYLDQHRLVSALVKGTPSGLKIQVKKRPDTETLVKQIFVAAANGKTLAEQLNAEGKIVTQGIKFLPGSATVLPESMGTLNAILKLMEAQPDVKLRIESHTDSQGDDRFNLKLSQQRAEATKTQLLKMGISPTRLAATGLGETQPVSHGDIPEMRLNNARTAFIKQ